MATPLTIETLMSTEVSEFVRLLPIALADYEYSSQPGSIEMLADRRTIRIGYESQPDLRIGSLRLPQLRIVFRFEGHDPAQAEVFATTFLKHYQRGGG